MKCPVCWRDIPLMRNGGFPRHRTTKVDDTSFCPMSGHPAPSPEYLSDDIEEAVAS